MELLFDTLQALQSLLLGTKSRLALLFLTATVLIVFVIWLVRGRQEGFLRFLLPKEVYLHRSNLVDIQIFLVNMVLGVSGLIGALVFTPVIAHLTVAILSSVFGVVWSDLDVTLLRSAAATVVVVVTMDFCKYWVHRVHHENRVLWPFHSLHHSAEVLTPLTVSRIHPVYLAIKNIAMSFVLGSVTGLMLFLLIGEVSLLTIGGAHAGYFLFNLLGANLRHSHVWLSYGPVLEHILISPAQHQIHHSRAVRHHDKNYGEVFAFWDWMFGTLYVPKGYEELEYGLADAEGNALPQPHPNLLRALVTPFVDSLGEVLGIDFEARAATRDRNIAGAEK